MLQPNIISNSIFFLAGVWKNVDFSEVLKLLWHQTLNWRKLYKKNVQQQYFEDEINPYQLNVMSSICIDLVQRYNLTWFFFVLYFMWPQSGERCDCAIPTEIQVKLSESILKHLFAHQTFTHRNPISLFYIFHGILWFQRIY